MSKFFKALENAAREQRERADGATAAPAGEPAAVAPVAAAVPEPIVVTAVDAAVAAAAITAPAAEPPAVPVPVEAPPRPVRTEQRAPRTPDRPPAYGAPVVGATPAVTTHARAFPGLSDPAPVMEPGQVDDHLVSLIEPTSFAAEQYRAIRLQIENLRRERDIHVVAVSSPGRGEGKTMTAINVAGALAQSPDARVVLVEADLRHPGIAAALGLPSGRGLSGYLLDPSLAPDAVIERPSGVGFSLVLAGAASTMPYELLKSPRLASLLGTLRERFDYVVVDTPPVLPFPDVSIVRDLVDGFVLLVRANQTPREMLRDSLHAIGTNRVIGVVFNDYARPGAVTPRGELGWRGRMARPLGGARAA